MPARMEFLKKLGKFLKDVAQDERIPDRDKAVLTAMIALIISPIDIIPDWIPVIGVLDDMVLAAIVLDYICNVLDDEVLLSHYPWGMKSYVRMKKAARVIAALTPQPIKTRIWQYQPDPYRKS
jgi:uncharacterized membrane protein YkvA (DUF1232 family)